jgi:hypothetical protein
MAGTADVVLAVVVGAVVVEEGGNADVGDEAEDWRGVGTLLVAPPRRADVDATVGAADPGLGAGVGAGAAAGGGDVATAPGGGVGGAVGGGVGGSVGGGVGGGVAGGGRTWLGATCGVARAPKAQPSTLPTCGW